MNRVWPQQHLPAIAGKSTLLDLIAGRKTIGELHDDILFSGIRPTQAFLRRYTGAAPLSSCSQVMASPGSAQVRVMLVLRAWCKRCLHVARYGAPMHSGSHACHTVSLT